MVMMKDTSWIAAIDSKRNLLVTDYVSGEVKMVNFPTAEEDRGSKRLRFKMGLQELSSREEMISIVHNSYDGRIYVGTNGSKILRFDPPTYTPSTSQFNLEEVQDLINRKLAEFGAHNVQPPTCASEFLPLPRVSPL